MKTIQIILVAVDFSVGSHAALAQAARIAEIQGAALHIVHVVSSAALESLVRLHGSNYEDQARTSSLGASAALDRWLEQSPVRVKCTIHILIGSPLHEILEASQKWQADLLVAGTAGQGNAAVGAGSVAGKLARKAHCRVLLVRPGAVAPFRKVVSCIDFSPTSREAAAAARRVALKDKASVEFVHVWRDPWAEMAYAVPYTDASLPQILPSAAMLEVYEQRLQNDLEEFVAEAAQGITASCVLIQAGTTGDALTEHARKSGADLVIVGRKGHSQLHYVLMGSTAERLLASTRCSLLVIPQTDAEAPSLLGGCFAQTLHSPAAPFITSPP